MRHILTNKHANYELFMVIFKTYSSYGLKGEQRPPGMSVSQKHESAGLSLANRRRLFKSWRAADSL